MAGTINKARKVKIKGKSGILSNIVKNFSKGSSHDSDHGKSDNIFNRIKKM